MDRISFHLLLSLPLSLVALSNSAFACSCEIPPPPCVQYWRTDTVFVGKVANVESNTSELFPKVTVGVEENYKGMNFGTAITVNFPSSCSFTFNSGERFLFYGSLDKKNPNTFGAGFCSGTTLFQKDLGDIEFLDGLKNKKSTYWIWATVSKDYFDTPAQGVLAEVLGIKPKLTAQSDQNGDLKIVVPKPGKYKVRMWLPKGKEWSGSLRMDEQLRKRQQEIWRGGGKSRKGRFMDFEVEVANNRCGWIDLPLMNNN